MCPPVSWYAVVGMDSMETAARAPWRPHEGREILVQIIQVWDSCGSLKYRAIIMEFIGCLNRSIKSFGINY